MEEESYASLQSVFDWVKEEGKISEGLFEQLSQIPQFNHLNKNSDEIEIELAYYEYRSSIDSKIGYDAYELPIVINPHEDYIKVLLEMKERKEEFI